MFAATPPAADAPAEAQRWTETPDHRRLYELLTRVANTRREERKRFEVLLQESEEQRVVDIATLKTKVSRARKRISLKKSKPTPKTQEPAKSLAPDDTAVPEAAPHVTPSAPTAEVPAISSGEGHVSHAYRTKTVDAGTPSDSAEGRSSAANRKSSR